VRVLAKTTVKASKVDIRDLFKTGLKKLDDLEWYKMLHEHLIFNMIKNGDIFNKYEKPHLKSFFCVLANKRLNTVDLPEPFNITKRKAKDHIQQRYKCIEKEIDNDVKSVLPTSITLSFDAWDGKRGQSFLGIIAKFVIMVRNCITDSNEILGEDLKGKLNI